MGLFVLDLFRRVKGWPAPAAELRDLGTFLAMPEQLDDRPRPARASPIAGGMFVVPLYAFLTTTVPKAETARTIAANNIVNSGLMVVGDAYPDGCGAAGRDGRRQPADRRRRKRHFRLAWLEAPPRLRLSVQARKIVMNRNPPAKVSANRRRSLDER